MRIEILETGGFGKFIERSFSFSPGFNLVYGNNEAGKSTLISMIEMLFYGPKKDGLTVKKFSAMHETYIPWRTEIYNGSMTFTLDQGRKLEVFRNFSKSKEEFQLHDINLGKDITREFSVDKRGEVLFAMDLFNMSRSVFLNTVMVPQLDLARGFDDETNELSADLIKSISGASKDNSTAKALALLEAALNRIGITDRGKRSGELSRLISELEEELQITLEHRAVLSLHQQRLESLESDEKILVRALEQIESSRASSSISSLKSNIQKAQKFHEKIAEDEKILDKYQEYSEFPLESFDQASRLEGQKTDKKNLYEQRANKLEKLEEELSITKASLQEFGLYCNLPENAAEEIIELKTSWQETEKNIADIKSQIDNEFDKTRQKQERLDELEGLFKALGESSGDSLIKLNQEEDETEKKLAEYSAQMRAADSGREKLNSKALNFAIIAAFTSISAALLSLAGFLNVHFPIYVQIILSIISLGFIIPALKSSRESKEKIGDVEEAERDFEKLSVRRKDIKKERSTFFSLAGVNDTSGFIKLEAEYNGLKELLGDNAVMLAQKRLPRFEADRAEITGKIMLRLRFVGLGGDEVIPKEQDIYTFKNNLKKARELELELQSVRKQKEELITELKGLEVEIDKIRVSLRSIYDTAGCRNLPEFISAKEGKVAWNSANNSRRMHQQNLVATLGDKSLEEHEAELGKMLELFGNTEADQAKDEYDVNDLRVARDELEELQQEIGPLKGEIAEMRRDSRDPGLIEAELEAGREEVSAINSRRESLKIAIEGINKASEKLHASFAPVLNEKISKMISAISSGRYNEVMISDDFNISVRDNSSRKIVPVNSLSNGTMDQVFFTSRIALADALTKDNERLPLFLDDSFVEYDEDRLVETLKLIKEIARDRQILLFTCHSREQKLASEIFKEEMNLINLQD